MKQWISPLAVVFVLLLAQTALAGPFRGVSTGEFVSQVSKKTGTSKEQVRKEAVDSLLRSKKFSDRVIKAFASGSRGGPGIWRAMRYLKASKTFRAAVGLESVRDAQLQAKLGAAYDRLINPRFEAPQLVKKNFEGFEYWNELGRFSNWKRDKNFNEVEASLPVLEGRAQLVIRIWENGGIVSGQLLFVPIRMNTDSLYNFRMVATNLSKIVNKEVAQPTKINLNFGPHSYYEGEAKPAMVLEFSPDSSHSVFFRYLVNSLSEKRAFQRALKWKENQ